MSDDINQLPGVAKAPRPNIPEGDYAGVLTTVGTCFFARGKKHQLIFRIDEGVYMGIEPCRFMNRKDAYGPNSDVYKFWVIASGKIPSKNEKLNLEPFLGLRFSFHTKTVKCDREGYEISTLLQYSVIDKIYKRLEGKVSHTLQSNLDPIPHNLEPFTSNPPPNTHHLPPTTYSEDVEDYSILAEPIGYIFKNDSERKRFNRLVDWLIGNEFYSPLDAYNLAYKHCEGK